MSVYKWLDTKLGGILPGGVPLGGSRNEGSDPENTANAVSKSAGAGDKNDNSGKKSEQPEKPKTSFVSYSYPDGLDNTDEFPHQIMFNVLIRQTETEYTANVGNLPDAGRGEDLASNLTNDQARALVADAGEFATDAAAITYGIKRADATGALVMGAGLMVSDSFGNKISELVQAKTARRNVARIRMAMPMSPKNEMTAEWNVTDFGAIMGMMLSKQTTGTIGDVIAGAVKNSADVQESLLRTAAGTLNIGKQMGLNIPLQSSIELMTRKVGNPYKETLFRTMNFRDFPFVFKFAPKNNHELLQALKIVNIFERYMTPKKSKSTMFLEYPAEFEIIYQYKNKENVYFTNFFNDTALTNFTVDYGNGGMYTSFRGTEGAPSEITMSMNFKELTLLHRDSIVDITDQNEVMGGFQGPGIGATVQGETPDDAPVDNKNPNGESTTITTDTDSEPQQNGSNG